METGRIMAKSKTATPNLQMKVTAFMSADLVVSTAHFLKCFCPKQKSYC